IGGAWKSLGEYRKAIGYIEKALAIFEIKLGKEHPDTKNVQKNLEAVRAKLR
ncbi:MAG: tetratricopeptide repeat protein, partial [Nitrospirae bacterium]|nr:tetratricopeptide repeat protein [Nitrospirota bacterium]